MRSATRSAQLSVQPEVAGGRYLLAAQCAVMASAPTDELVDAAKGLGSPAVRAEACVIEAAAAAWSGDSEVLRRLIDVDLAEVAAHDRSLAGIVCAFGSVAAFNRLALEEARALSERAWDLVDGRLDLPHPFGLMPAISVAIHGLNSGVDRTDELLAAQAAVEAAEAVDLATPLAVGFLVADRHADALEFADRMLAIARSRNNVMAAAWIMTARAMAADALGHLRTAHRWASDGRDLGMACGNDFLTAQACAVLARVAA